MREVKLPDLITSTYESIKVRVYIGTVFCIKGDLEKVERDRNIYPTSWRVTKLLSEGGNHCDHVIVCMMRY